MTLFFFVLNADDTDRKRPSTKERSGDKAETVVGGAKADVIDFTYKAAASSRMMDFLSTDQTSANAKEKDVKSLYLKGLSHSTVIILTQFVLVLLFACLFTPRRAIHCRIHYMS